MGSDNKIRRLYLVWIGSTLLNLIQASDYFGLCGRDAQSRRPIDPVGQDEILAALVCGEAS